ncbi:MAG: hypothetical protein F6K11_24155 [Leptolyngbya sp. SIO3F4]|nr:hypothetical protein [Leptolyngbya sp. SIO3F4]
MKKLFLSISIVIISFCVKAQYNDIKIGPIGLLGPHIHLMYQRTINKNFTAAVGIDVGRLGFSTRSGTGINGTLVTFRRMVYGLVGDFRFYPIKKQVAPKGFFTGVHIRNFIIHEQEPDMDLSATNNILNTGLNLGYQWIWGNFTMEVLGGYGFSKALIIDSERNLLRPYNQDDLSNLGNLRFQFNIGVVFPRFKKID